MVAGAVQGGKFGTRSGKFDHGVQARGYACDVQALTAHGGGQAVPAARVQRHAQRELVRRRQQHRLRHGGGRDDGAPAVDGNRPQAQALPDGHVAVGRS
ncbi:MAG TPA: hypothetical protein VGU21_00925 [Streptosporangiaceae bacterium]|nr:hypothetical protein [Streptosporangiaceae bacterium]